MTANDRQVGGEHYRGGIQHWDWATSEELDYFQGCITKYVARWRKKGGISDLEKAQHYLEKYIEVEKARAAALPESFNLKRERDYCCEHRRLIYPQGHEDECPKCAAGRGEPQPRDDRKQD